jgi:hypothetical protein
MQVLLYKEGRRSWKEDSTQNKEGIAIQRRSKAKKKRTKREQNKKRTCFEAAAFVPEWEVAGLWVVGEDCKTDDSPRDPGNRPAAEEELEDDIRDLTRGMHPGLSYSWRGETDREEHENWIWEGMMREIAGSKVTEQWCVEERKERKERRWETADL